MSVDPFDAWMLERWERYAAATDDDAGDPSDLCETPECPCGDSTLCGTVDPEDVA